MKALSFLGTGTYQTTTYVWQKTQEEKTCTTHLFPEAVANLFSPDQVVLFVTPQVEAHEHFQTITERLGEQLRPVPIPEGKSEEELWQIFDLCVAEVEEGEEVILDVTHAFRSLPLVVFTVAAYLRRAKRVKLTSIVYGAFEAREPLSKPPQPTDRAPVFDLTPLANLLDWISGAESFLRTGDASLLADKLIETHRNLWKARLSNELPRQLQGVGRQLGALSKALTLSRPREVMRYANALLPLLDEVTAEAERWAKPFAAVLGQVRDSVATLAYDAPDQLDRDNLRVQLQLIEHYLSKGLIMQAVTLAREWMVSWTIHRRGEGRWLDKTYRMEEVERGLNVADRLARGKTGELPNWFQQWSDWQTVGKLWNWLGQLRNDVAHCGMSRDAVPVSSIERRADKISSQLHGLLEGSPEHVLLGNRITIDLKSLYGEIAKLDALPDYLERAKEQAGEGSEVVLTGQAPIWLYLAVAHAIHGKARRLLYESPTTGEIAIFDHRVN